MSRVLKAGVAGAGVFGRYHALKYAALPATELVGVFDPDAARAQALAAETGSRAFSDFAALLEAVEVATVAAPAVRHAALAGQALDAGVHVYVEKPLATTTAEAARLIDKAAAGGLVLSCGHQERAVFQAMGLLQAGRPPLRLEAVRRSPFTGRAADVSTVLDMMIHDLDLALRLNPSEPVTVTARGSAPEGPELDEVEAEVRFADGMTFKVAASRVFHARERTMKAFYPQGAVEIDFMTRAFSNGAGLALDPGFADTEAGRDPLGANVSSFLDAVAGRAARPLVSGAEALRALDLALRIEAAARG